MIGPFGSRGEAGEGRKGDAWCWARRGAMNALIERAGRAAGFEFKAHLRRLHYALLSLLARFFAPAPHFPFSRDDWRGRRALIGVTVVRGSAHGPLGSSFRLPSRGCPFKVA
jgi:hypothetical protein